METLTAEILRSLFSYDPCTGEFRRLTNRGSLKIGDIAGTISPQGYVYISVKKAYPAHRLAWLHVHGDWPKGDIDHINRNRKDNRIANLRDVPRSTNVHNSQSCGNASGMKGVYPVSESKRSANSKNWEASISVNRVSYHLGRYSTREEAVNARNFAEQLFGVSPPIVDTGSNSYTSPTDPTNSAPS